jgi:cytochrome oxidase Cu insertion factor (SCO1/SenC/PrrC family)
VLGVLILVAAVLAMSRRQSPTQDASVAELPTAPEVGALAPDFQLPSKDGELVKLSDYRGQPVAVTFMHTW